MSDKRKSRTPPSKPVRKSLRLTCISDHQVAQIQDLPDYRQTLRGQVVQVNQDLVKGRVRAPVEIQKPSPGSTMVRRSAVSFTAKKTSSLESSKNLRKLVPVPQAQADKAKVVVPENSGQPSKPCHPSDLEKLFPHLTISKISKKVDADADSCKKDDDTGVQKLAKNEAEESHSTLSQRRARKAQRPVKLILQPKIVAGEKRPETGAKLTNTLAAKINLLKQHHDRAVQNKALLLQPNGTAANSVDFGAKSISGAALRQLIIRRSAERTQSVSGVPELKVQPLPRAPVGYQTPVVQPLMAPPSSFIDQKDFYRFGNFANSGPTAPTLSPSLILPQQGLIRQSNLFSPFPQQTQIPSLPTPNLPFQIKTEIKEEPMLTEVKQEPTDDYWPALPSLPSEIEIDQILRQDIKREALPFEVQERLEILKNNDRPVPPPCGCNLSISQEASYGLYYSQLGYGRTLKDIREMMEKRTGVSGPVALRIEQAVYCHREGKSQTGCPIAKEVIKRTSLDEKFLVVVKKRDGHQCEQVYMVMGIVVWDGIPRPLADRAYATIKDKVALYGHQMERHCEANSAKTCACQGADLAKEGMSYSFGCSWNCYYNTCKFAKSGLRARKYHLTSRDQEQYLEAQVNELANVCGPLLEQIAPQAFFNMTAFNTPENICRVGTGPIEKRPFSGTSTVLDFCAHAHHDSNNMNNGTTMVVTLLKPENREFGKPRSDRQLHVLPNYRAADVDENGSREGQLKKIKSGGFEALNEFNRTYGIRKFRKTRPKSSRAMGMSCAKKKRITPEMIARERQKMMDLMQRHSTNVPYFVNPGSQFIIPQTDGANDLNDVGGNIPATTYPGLNAYLPPAAANALPDDSISYVTHSNRELFSSRDIGGLAFELEHGTVLIESARHENHATTALNYPDRNNPTRIGLVFYQHKNLIYPRHGNDEVKVKEVSKFQRYYKMMQNGMFIPTERQLSVMLDQGFKFPSTVLVAPPRKPRDGAGHELPLDIISSTHGCYFITNPTLC